MRRLSVDVPNQLEQGVDAVGYRGKMSRDPGSWSGSRAQELLQAAFINGAPHHALVVL